MRPISWASHADVPENSQGPHFHPSWICIPSSMHAVAQCLYNELHSTIMLFTALAPPSLLLMLLFSYPFPVLFW